MTRTILALLGLTAGLCCLGQPLQACADVVTSGDVEPSTDPAGWTIPGELIVGRTSDGSLRVDLGSTVDSKSASLGYAVGSRGTATVNGVGSTWTSYDLAIGINGTGILSIEAGGQVSDTVGYLGASSVSTGTVTVTGAGSTWTNSSGLYVRGNSSSTLTVSDGGLVTAGTLFAATSNLLGNGTIAANGAVLDAGVVFDSTHGTTQSLPFGSGGALNLTVNETGTLGAGYTASGTLRISDGVVVTSGGGCLGYSASSNGTATVSGTGSTWINKFDLFVGDAGNGSMTVSDGGLVTARTVYASLGNLAGNGTIRATGAVLDADLVFDKTHGTTQNIAFGSGGALNLTVDATSVLGIGYKGNGSMSVADGVTVTSNSSYLGYKAGSSGTATVGGPGSTWNNKGYSLYIGYYGAGLLNIENGAQCISNSGTQFGYNAGSNGMVTVKGAGSTWVNSFDFSIGFYGSGTLRIEAGGQVSDRSSYLGQYPGSNGTVIVTGTGSTWANSSSLYVGGSGNGSLTVSDGGLVTAKTLYASLGNLAGNGTINVTAGAVLDTDLVFDSAHGTTQSLAFGNGGVLNLTVGATDVLGAGYKGSGGLRIADGVTVTSKSAYLGYNAGSSGTATVSGAASTWNNNSEFYVGYYGSGTLSIEAGARVNNSANAYIADRPGSSGRAMIRGLGAAWTVYGLNVGGFGNGALNIEAGAHVNDTYGELGVFGGSGTATVTGVGSTWTNSSSLDVGNEGSGTVTISNGGQVTARSVSVNSQSLLAIDVTGGSRLTVNNGTGTISNSGKIRVLAGAGAATGGPYSPISAGSYGYSDNYQGVGGKWDATAHTFAVYDSTVGTAATELSIDLSDRQRLTITDPETHWLLGASFLAATSAKTLTLTATPISGAMQTSLEPLLEGETLLGGWQFAVGNGYATGDPAYLGFDVGANRTRSDFSVWRYNGSAWAAYDAADLSYDGRYASFSVTDLSGYAVSTVPEPGTLALLVVGLLGIGCVAFRRQSSRRGGDE